MLSVKSEQRMSIVYDYLKSQIIGLLYIYKALAFHEIYMKQRRKDLAQDYYFDPLTAFKCIDSFKHNKIVSYELFSFLYLFNIVCTLPYADEVIKALNKSQDSFDYDTFQYMILPENIIDRNISLTRFHNVVIEVGSFARLTKVKERTYLVIARFFEKEIEFVRYFLFKRQYFLHESSPQIHELFQRLFQDKPTLSFEYLFDVTRKYKIVFNRNEYDAIWRRSRKVSGRNNERIWCKNELKELLLVGDFKNKQKYYLEANIPLKKVHMSIIPSYRRQHWHEYEEKEIQKKYSVLTEYARILAEDKRRRRLLDLELEHFNSRGNYLRSKENEWNKIVDGMDALQIDEYYKRCTMSKAYHKSLI